MGGIEGLESSVIGGDVCRPLLSITRDDAFLTEPIYWPSDQFNMWLIQGGVKSVRKEYAFTAQRVRRREPVLKWIFNLTLKKLLCTLLATAQCFGFKGNGASNWFGFPITGEPVSPLKPGNESHGPATTWSG